MVKKPRTSSAAAPGATALTESIKDSAQAIWLAGLGAYSRAQEEGGKVFEALVKQGQTLQKKSAQRGEPAAGRPAPLAESLAPTAAAMVTGPWDRLEGIFEDRVARALERLEVPTALEFEALVNRIHQLELKIQSLSKPDMAGAPRPKTKLAKGRRPKLSAADASRSGDD